MDKNIRRRIIIIVIICVTLIGFVFIAILLQKKGDTPVNKAVTSLRQTPKTDSNTRVIPETKSGIYELGALESTSLTATQKTHIEFELIEFISAYTGEKITYVTLDRETLKTTYNSERSANELRFNVKSNSGAVYTVSGLYVAGNDMYITVYDSKNNIAYFEPYDEGGQ